jgi:hypothetical protein
MAEAYFDNKNREMATNVRHKQNTIEAFGRLPEVFIIDDVIRCFSMKDNNSATSRVGRLIRDRYVEKVEEFIENGTTKAKYKKTGKLML